MRAIRQQFVPTFTKPWAEPIAFFHPSAGIKRDLWVDAGVVIKLGADALLTAGVRLASPGVLALGLSRYLYRRGGWARLAALPAAPLGAALGFGLGAVGIAFSLVGAGACLAGAAFLSVQAGVRHRQRPAG